MDIQITFQDGPIEAEISAEEDEAYSEVLEALGEFVEDFEPTEPIGPQEMLDILVVAPCTGNTAAKLATAITDTVVTMSVKAHLRNQKPIVLAIATNDALGNNGKNISQLINTPNIYMVPFGQDNPLQKAKSLVARMELIVDTIEYALSGRQLQPVIIEHHGI